MIVQFSLIFEVRAREKSSFSELVSFGFLRYPNSDDDVTIGVSSLDPWIKEKIMWIG